MSAAAAAPIAASVTDFAGVAMLLLGLVLPVQRRSGAAARLAAWQGGLLALAAASAAWGGGAAGPGLWPVALGAAAGRALLLPVLLRLATNGGGTAPRAGDVPPAVPGAVALLLAGGGLAVLAVAAVTAAGTGMEPGTREGLALSLATLLLGLLAMLGRRRRGGAPSGLIGLVAAENGALLGLVHAGGVPGGAAALAVLSPGLVACVALAALRGGGGRGGVLRAAVPRALRR